jgi:dTDP-glucose pyrophosphorylase
MNIRTQSLILNENSSFYDAIKKLDENGNGALTIIDNKGLFIGLITDGDVRRALLNKHLDLDYIINKHPYKMSKETTTSQRIAYLKQVKRRHLPIVDKDNILLGIFTLDSVDFQLMHNPVVIMAGGLGKRLEELTKEIPKPMLQVGDKPLLETILLSFLDQGFHRFYISVNYKKEIIMEYFGNGSKWGVDIEYLVEESRLGTAGALSLIQENHTNPIVVTNGDVLTNMDYDRFLRHHLEQKSQATMCVREYEYIIPYGVIEVEGYNITTLTEKPKKLLNVNAGVYVIEPEVISKIPKDTYYDMTTLFEDVAKINQRSCVYFLKDYWIDVGQIKELKQANIDLNITLNGE